jgi:cytoskeletal protein RodZ
MDEKQVASEKQGEKEEVSAPSGSRLSKKQLNLALVVVAVLLLLVGGGSYLFGSRRGQVETPSEEEATTESAEVEEIEDATPSPTGEPTDAPEGLITPSPGPTPTTEPTPTPTPTPTTETLSSAASLDGFRSSNGGGNNGVDIRSGRNIFLITRGFVSFGSAHIPSDATIEKATLRVYQAKVIGDPYGVGVRVKVDH